MGSGAGSGPLLCIRRTVAARELVELAEGHELHNLRGEHPHLHPGRHNSQGQGRRFSARGAGCQWRRARREAETSAAEWRCSAAMRARRPLIVQLGERGATAEPAAQEARLRLGGVWAWV